MFGARSSLLPGARRSLSMRLLVLTVFFVMVAEVLIYVPSIANFRERWLEDRIAAAHLAILALEATPDQMVSENLKGQLLDHAGAHAIVMHKPGVRQLLAAGSLPAMDLAVHLGEGAAPALIWQALATLSVGGDRVLRVLGPSPKASNVTIEVLIDEAPLRAAMLVYSRNIVVLSIFISVITAALVYVSIHWLLVRPMRRITEGVTQFAENPEDLSAGVPSSNRRDEIGAAQTVLVKMQGDLRAALRQKEHLAALGSAVAKINHDLRGILSTAVLLSDRLATIDDPTVKRIAAPLIQSIDRAIALCTQTLNFARDQGPRLHRSRFPLGVLVSEVGEDLSAVQQGPCPIQSEIGGGLTIEADREQLYRVFANLARNAVEAGADAIRVSATNGRDGVAIDIIDNGPGLPQRAQKSLFQAFAGSARKGGTGLGLAIARDVMRAHGGDIVLVSTGEAGTQFRLALPGGAPGSRGNTID